MIKSRLTTDITPAKNLDEIWKNFDPMLTMDPRTEFYIQRTDPEIRKLFFDLKKSQGIIHAFLCGHRGSGKTTELNRLCQDEDIQNKYHTLYLSIQDFGSETVHLTHDAVLLEMGLALTKQGKEIGLPALYEKELEDWGKEVVKTFLKDKNASAEVSTKVGAWFTYFKAQLGIRQEWKREEKQILEPRVQDLVGILNRLAREFKNRGGKELLVVVDDLEKGDSDAHREMHKRLFLENYDTMVQPRFSIVYTLPVYFRALESNRVPNDQLYAFSAVRLYEQKNKHHIKPPLCTGSKGYKLMRGFVEKRIAKPGDFFAPGVLDELLRIGGGLFRETARAVREAAYLALQEGDKKIGMAHAEYVFHQVKKEYQPVIRGDAVSILKQVSASVQGWVPGVEPFLQSRAVVEYENHNLWIDVRYVLKSYIQEIKIDGSPGPAPGV
ncbi:MAG: hypothetical protein KAW12_04510 [Candidatus Aminicenantes bacterium]|nr:hypothetical protein [Candidatus Aminicenantes bacterium]